MPIPEKKLWNPETLHRWFAVSSILMTFSFIWMIVVDYDRPWRGFQRQFFVDKAALAHLDYVESLRRERVDEIAEARQRLENAQELASRTSGRRRARLVTDLTAAQLGFNKVNGAWRRKDQVLQVTRDTYEKVLGTYGADHRKTILQHQTVTDEEDEVDRLRMEKERYEDEVDRLEQELKELDETVQSARKQLEELVKVGDDALKKDQSFRGVLDDSGLLAGIPIVSTFINLPLIDFLAPKTTPVIEKVHQLVLPEVRQRLNYLESYTTDRCTTCHVAIDDPEFSKEQLARKLESSLPAVNEALARMGRDPLALPAPPTPKDREAALPIGKVTQHWDELNEQQQDAYFEALLELTNKYLSASERKELDLDHPILAHPNLDLFVSVDSPHPMNRMGCTVCHEGNPQETDFVQAAHTPPTHEIHEEWARKYYIRPLGIPNVTFETIEHYWDRPMRVPAHTEASCAKCHSEISDVARFEGERVGSRINLGRHLFVNVGCVDCHDVDGFENPRRVGPSLTHLGSKLTPAFVQQWAMYPQKFRPSTRMPHFFGQENNRTESANSFDPDPVLRTEAEVVAITKYLFTVSKPQWQPLAKPEGVTGDVERGRELFKTVGCLACHANIAEFGPTWIPADIAQREKVSEETAKHRYLGMTDDERVRYAMEHFANERDTFLDPETTRFNPEQPYNTPTLTRFAPELSGIGSKVTPEWLYSWLMKPTHYSPDTIMPDMRLTPVEAADLAVYLMSLRNESFEQFEFELDTRRRGMVDDVMFTLLSTQRSQRRSRSIMENVGGELNDMIVAILDRSMEPQEAKDLVGSMDVDEMKLMYVGNKMIAHYGCYACHDIGGFEKTTPPGTDLSEWAEKPVSQLDFAFYDHAFEHLREEKQEVFGSIYPHDAHELNDRSPIADDAPEEVSLTHAAFAKHKMLNPRIWDREKIKRPYDKLKMPNFYFTQEEAEALTTFLLSRIPPRIADSLKVDYNRGTRGAIARGRNLARELNCVGCHQIEDNAPTIQQYFRREVGGQLTFDSFNAPPLLWGQGAKVQHNWMHSFLQNVETLRPWLQVRMPSFTLTGEEATTLVKYFAALSQQDSIDLDESSVRVHEYIENQKSRAAADSSENVENAGSDWFLQEPLESSATELRRWVIERKLLRAADLDPLRVETDRLKKAHVDLLDRVDFMQALYDVAYPFVEPPKPLSSKERSQRGRRFLKDMGCLQCHVLGEMLPGPAKNTDDFVQMYRLDGVRGKGESAVAILNGQPYPVGSKIDGHTLVSASNIYNETGDVTTFAEVEGPSKEGSTEKVVLTAPSAPNLSLTYRRLRRAWVYGWMLEPQWIQPGTKMPQNFAGGVSPFEGDEAYPGTGADHINLLVDYLYYAGTANVRAPLVKAVVSDDDEEGEFDEDDFDDD